MTVREAVIGTRVLYHKTPPPPEQHPFKGGIVGYIVGRYAAGGAPYATISTEECGYRFLYVSIKHLTAITRDEEIEARMVNLI
jgi:hypothetical protein